MRADGKSGMMVWVSSNKYVGGSSTKWAIILKSLVTLDENL